MRFPLCPDSHFAQEQFYNFIAQGKNSYIAQRSENYHFAQGNSRIVPILTLRRTYRRTFSRMWRHFSAEWSEL